MKCKHIIYFFLFLLLACNQRNNDSVTDSVNVTDSFKELKQPVTTKLLFGSDILATFRFPLYWALGEEADKEDKLFNEKYIKAYQFYSVLRKRKTIPKPEVDTIEYLNLGFSHPSCVDSTNKLIDSIRYKLASIGPYECYYSQQMGAQTAPVDSLTYEEEIHCAYGGNLIFYNPKTKKAKVANVFFSAASHISSDVRLFYIDINNTIYTYRAQSSETDMKFQNEFLIHVKKDGRIEIVKNKEFN